MFIRSGEKGVGVSDLLSIQFPEYNQIVKSIQRADILLNGQRRALELLARRAPLFEVLHLLVSILEEQYEGLFCSILLVDEQTRTFRAGVEVSSSRSYSTEVSGVSFLPPYVGPCCLAANLREVVVSEDIATDTRWQDTWKNWAHSKGIKSCRSHPIFSSTGAVLGTFALYHKNFSDPAMSNLYQIELTTHIAGIAIERKLIEARETEWREKMERLNAELANAVKLRDEFLSMTTHEINSPLATMKMRTAFEKESLLEGGELDRSEILKMLESHEAQIDKVISLVRTITDTSYLDSGGQALNRTRLDLCALVQECCARLSPVLEQASYRMKLNLDQGVFGEWDQIRLEQVLTNLVTNAVKYSGGDLIEVSVRNLGRVVQIEVADNGIGIVEADQKRIFERYQRLHFPKIQASGLGLGLYIVKEIIEAHEGRVYVDSKLGQGAKFIVELPVILN